MTSTIDTAGRWGRPGTGAGPDEATPAADSKPGRAPASRVLKPLVLLALLVGLWQVLVSAGALPRFEVAAPSSIASYVAGHAGDLFANAGTTLEEVFIAFLLALAAGLVLAVAIHHSKLLEDALLPLLVVSQVIPSIAIAPLLVLLLGFGIAPKVVVAAIISFFPILINTLAGLRSLNGDMTDLSRAIGVGGLQRLRYFTLPNSLPYVFAGCRVAVTLSVIGAVVGEFVTAKSGLGYLILQGSSQIDPPLMFSALVFLAVLGILLFSAVRAIEYALVPWARTEKP